MTHPIGIVAIGRNEGERLRACLASVVRVPNVSCVVYVDSGSTDGSVAMARSMGASVVELDLSIPFTAARARNEGFDRLLSGNPSVTCVQFVDGDCEVVSGWIDRAVNELTAIPQAAVVCGRRRERFPEKTIYNRLCDIEWNTPVGEAKSCGGDAMIRAAAFLQVGGYDATLIAGEEPEMCLRLREHGWTIHRIDAEMTLHDAAMTRFAQWWRRNVRAGHAYAEGAAMHGQPPERMNARAVRSNWVWGLIAPLLALSFAWPTYGWSLSLLALYPLLMFRVYQGRRLTRIVAATPALPSLSSQHAGNANVAPVEHASSPRDARLYAFFIVLGKFPQAMGQLQYHLNRLTGRRARIIEYKGPATSHAIGGGSA